MTISEFCSDFVWINIFSFQMAEKDSQVPQPSTVEESQTDTQDPQDPQPSTVEESQLPQPSTTEGSKTTATENVQDSQTERVEDSQETLLLSPNLWSPQPLPSTPNDDEANGEESDESEGSGNLTPPHGMVISSDGRIHGDASHLSDPMTLMIMSAMSRVFERKAKGKGKGGYGEDGEGQASGAVASSSVEQPDAVPKAKAKVKGKAVKSKGKKRN